MNTTTATETDWSSNNHPNRSSVTNLRPLNEAVFEAEKMLEDGNEELARRVLRDALKRGER
jgi:hypothetical protein